MATSGYDIVKKYLVTAKCAGPLHIGSAVGGSEEVLVHPVTGTPFIQASSIAGVLRSYYQSVDQARTELLFGASRVEENTNAKDFASRLRITDGHFSGKVKIELRPHVKIDRASGTVQSQNGSGQKFNMEYIGEGAEFTFAVYLFEDSESADKLSEFLDKIFAAFRDGELQFGAKKSNGSGKVLLKSVLYKCFDLKRQEGRRAWAQEDTMHLKDYDDLDYLKHLPENSESRKAYRILIKAQTEGAIQIKGIAVNEVGKNAPDSENMRNANNDFIIPGSSLKGAIRNQMESIAAFIDRKALIEMCFGTENRADAETRRGNLIFGDVVIGNRAANESAPLRHRIHIDKLTGGVMHSALFCERNASGSFETEIDILQLRNAKATLGLLLMALRDLSIGAMSLGNGYATGKGIIQIDEIQVEDINNNKNAILYTGKQKSIEDPQGIISEAISALKDWRE